MRHLLTALLLIAAMISSAVPVRSYTLQLTDASSNIQIKWPTNTINIALSTSLAAPQGNIKAGSDVIGAARRALARWSEVANIQFVEDFSNAQSISAKDGKSDGISLITIARTPENRALFNGASGETPGRTRIFFTKAGEITEADVVLNPNQEFSTDGTPGTYDLEAVFTHEIGHLLGLEHSGIIGATMQPRQGRNGIYNSSALASRTLSSDDRAGVRAIYGMRPGVAVSARGAITGTISHADGAPAFGANVWAEEIATGRVSASNITLMSGVYRIENLMPGSYRIIVCALNGPVLASEIASQRGAYAGLAGSKQLAFRTQEIGQVEVMAGLAMTLNAQLSNEPPLVRPSLIGLNGQLSTVAVPLARGNAYTLYIGGEDITKNQIPATGVTITSPFITVDPASVMQEQLGANVNIISFTVTVSPNAPLGDYSLRLQSHTGEVAYIAGGLTIGDSGNASGAMADQGRMLIAPAVATDIAQLTLTQ